METAVVTGSSSGIGEAIARFLLSRGFRVIGISRSAGLIEDENFSHLRCDLSNPSELRGLKKQLPRDVKILINSAGFGRFAPHEELDIDTILSMSMLNLTAPIALANMMLRELKQSGGIIINITSIEATRYSRHSGLYSATKAGLRSFGLSLFEEVRNAGVRVVTINPDMTDTSFFDNLRFGVGSSDDTKLFCDDLVRAIEYILDSRDGVCVSEMTIRPQKFGITKK